MSKYSHASLLQLLITLCRNNIRSVLCYRNYQLYARTISAETSRRGGHETRQVSLSLEYSKFAILWIYMYYEILFFWVYFYTIYRISRLYYYICILHYALASLALFYHVIELCTRHWTFVHTFETVSFFSSVFILFRSLRYYFILTIWLETHRDSSRIILHNSASICPRVTASRETERTLVDAMTVVESRY